MLALAKEVNILKKIYEDAEKKIIRIVEYQQKNKYVDYASVAQLEKVRKILEELKQKAYKAIPKVLEKQYYLSKQYSSGKYVKAISLTSTDTQLVEKLINQLEIKLEQATQMAQLSFQNMWSNALIIGRMKPDVIREKSIKAVIADLSTGGLEKANRILLEELKKKGLTAFIDKRGRHWNLSSYCNMCTRTTALQTRNLGLISTEQDLWQISSHSGSCEICKPYEGKVYSKSGLSEYYPPLATAFGKIDKDGPNELYNTYLCIHPNCLHVLMPYTEQGKTDKEIERMRKFSNSEYKMSKEAKVELEQWRQKAKGEQLYQRWWNEYKKQKAAGTNEVKWQAFLNRKLKNYKNR